MRRPFTVRPAAEAQLHEAGPTARAVVARLEAGAPLSREQVSPDLEKRLAGRAAELAGWWRTGRPRRARVQVVVLNTSGGAPATASVLAYVDDGRWGRRLHLRLLDGRWRLDSVCFVPEQRSLDSHLRGDEGPDARC